MTTTSSRTSVTTDDAGSGPGPRRFGKGGNRSRALGALASVFSVVAFTVLATAPAHASVYNTAIRNVTTRKCVDLPGFGAPGLQPVTQYKCRPGTGDNQMFDLVNGVDGFLIRSVKSPGLCLDFPNFGAPTSADKVSLYYCRNTTADNQLWKSRWNSAHTAFQLISAKTYSSGSSRRGMCLDVDGFAWAVNDLRLGAYPCSTSLRDDHWWTFFRG
ncbi:RICIN domain-containing protein [Streptomyces sp. T028]|uniref:RICIN domain-containing protein n=1 Tax=Streptomyces sp. T028 TaxID=3394379 RepID=UPI003A8795A4